MEHELIPVYTKFTGNGVRVQNDSIHVLHPHYCYICSISTREQAQR